MWPLLRRLAAPGGSVVAAASLLLAAALGVVSLGGGQEMSPSWSTRAETSIEDVRRLLPDGTEEVQRFTKRLQVTRVGASLQELRGVVEAIDSNQERAVVSARLLDELACCSPEGTGPQRAAAVADLIWRTWLFHEHPVVKQLMVEGGQLLSQGDLAGAEWRFQNAAHFDPHYAEAWNKLATVHYLAGQPQLSLAEVQRTLDLEPRHFGALSGRGLLLLQLERFGEAAQAFRESQEVFPASGGGGVAMAEALQAESAASTGALSPELERLT